MSSMMRWDPSRDIVSLRDMMDRLFEDAFVTSRGMIMPFGSAELAMDMYETKDDVVVTTALPGVKPEDVDITITGDTLTIRGETKEETENQKEKQNYLRRERRYGEFTRTITLPSGLQTDKAEASFDNGMLTLKIPKSEQAKPKSIKVQPKGQALQSGSK